MAKLVATFLSHIVEAERTVEGKREKLAEMNDFHPK